MGELVRYRIPSTLIDGPELEHDANWRLELHGQLQVSVLSDGMGGPEVAIRTLRILDWTGPAPLLSDPTGEELARGSAVIAATIHDALHPEAPWAGLPQHRRGQLAGFMARLIADGVIVPGPAVLGTDGMAG